MRTIINFIYIHPIYSILIGSFIATITSPSFWKLVKIRNKCKDCYGLGGDFVDGENVWLDCETCKNKEK